MIEWMIGFSIQNRIGVILVSLLLAALGVVQCFRLPIDALPDVTNIQVSVVTKAPGLSPSEVEQFITYPLELLLNGLPEVNQIRSISRTGVSSVTVIFNDSVDIYFGRQLVNERLRQTQGLIPSGYGTPELSPIATGLGDIYELILHSDHHSPEELRTYLDWNLGPLLKSVPGVIDINVFGGELKQFQVVIDPTQLAFHNISLLTVLEKMKNSNLNVGGGYITKGPELQVIRGEGQFKSLDEIKKVPLRTSSSSVPLLLGQIARVRTGPALKYGVMTQAGQGEAVGMTVIMLKGQNSRDVVQAVKKKVATLEKDLPAGMKIDSYYDRSEFISRTLKTVFINLTEAAFLVVLVLFLSLGSVKGALLVSAAIPFSMLIAVSFMKGFGIVGNIMSLGAIDFGLLVDGAVVILEAVLVELAIRNHKSPIDAIHEGCKRVGRASAFSVGIILLVYLPLMSLQGVEGRMFRPMALTVALALGTALVFSLTTFPAALALIYKKAPTVHFDLWKRVLVPYEKGLRWIQARGKTCSVFGTIFVIACLCLAGKLGTEFLPRIDEGEISIDIKRLPSTSIQHSKELNQQIEKVLMGFPEVISVVSKMGRGESAAEPIGTEEGEIMVKLKDKSEWRTARSLSDLMSTLKSAILQKVPSSYISMSQPIEDRVNKLIAGSKADVVVKIQGNDLMQLKKLSEQFSDRIDPIHGVGDLRIQRILGLPMLEAKLDRESLGRYGVDGEEVLRSVEAFRVGVPAGKVFEGLRRFDLSLILGIDPRSSESVENVPIMTSQGTTIPLGLVASIQKAEGPAVIYREAMERRVFVEINVRGRDLGGFVHEAQAKTADITNNLPDGYKVSWEGQIENFTRAKQRLSIVFPVILLIIAGMLVVAFKDFWYAISVFLMVPLALSGGILALFLRGLHFSIPAAVGFIALSGVTVLTGIVYITALKAELKKGVLFEEALIQAGIRSARPNLTTALIAAIGFFPMAISSGAGAEVQRPLATVVIGGMLGGGLFSLVLLPVIVRFLKEL